MKKVSIVLALLVLPSMSVLAQGATSEAQVNYNNPYYNKPSVVQRQDVYAEKNSKVYKKSSGNQYLQKYNIDDLEDAPWLHGGQRNLND